MTQSRGDPRRSAGCLLVVYSIGVLIVGIGFVALLTGAAAQRFLVPQIEEVMEVAEEVETTDAELLAELRGIRSRLDRLEAGLEKRPGF